MDLNLGYLIKLHKQFRVQIKAIYKSNNRRKENKTIGREVAVKNVRKKIEGK